MKARQAAAAGIDFVVVVAAIVAIERWKHLNTPGEIAVHASHNIFATVTLLHGIAAVLLFWFVSTLAARMRQLEGGSGRLAAAVNGSGAIIAGVLAIGVGAMWASHQLQSPESAALATSLIDGPTLLFPAAVLVGASGVIGFRAPGLPGYSRLVSRLSIPLALAFIGGGALILYKDYAWINDTGYITFGVWVLVVSIIGIVRWGDLDAGGVRAAAPVVDEAPARRRREPEPEPEPEPEAQPARRREARKRREPRKFAPRHTDLAREYQERLHETEDEPDVTEEDDDDDEIIDVVPASDDKEEFGYGGPPRMREAVEVTPAKRRAPRKKPAPRKAAPRKPAPRRAASDEAAPTKPAPRKPRPPRKFAPRAPRASEPTEIIEPLDDE